MRSAARPNFPAALIGWIDRNILALGREMRLSYLPPLMVYAAAGISGLTAVVGTFYVKERLGLSAEFLAALGFWMMLPWALKMPLGHLVDLIWRWKSLLVYLGAGLIALSLLVMIGLLGYTEAMQAIAPVETWYVVSSLLAPVGYVVQDVVADAMTVEAVPRCHEDGSRIGASELKTMHTTMQTLGRVAIIGGSVAVSTLNIFLLSGVDELPPAQKKAAYLFVYELALVIPLVSVLGVVLAWWLRRKERARLMGEGRPRSEAKALLERHIEPPPVNWWILGGGLAFTAITLSVGLGQVPGAQEIVFCASLTIVIFMIWRLTRELEPDARHFLVGTAIVIFAFRATPTPGAGATWWVIDVLGFDQQFLAALNLIASSLTLLSLFVFRRFMAEHSIAYVVGVLTVLGALLSLPNLAMFYGFHIWTAAHTNGIVDARFIALVDTALESPLGQIAMIPMLAWIANCAPEKLKATFFAVMASFTNLALSAAQLGTKYLNQIFVITREVRDAGGKIVTPADYSELGVLLATVMVIGLALPFLAIVFARLSRLRNA